MKIAFFEIKDWEKEYLKSRFTQNELMFFPGKIDEDNLLEDTEFEIISTFTDSIIEETVTSALPKLKFIATRTTGFDHINLEETAKRNILVSNVPAYGDNTVAEQSFALLLNISRKISKANEQIKEVGSFDTSKLQGFDLMGKTIGIIGAGRIGQHAIKIANGFGMKVIVCDAVAKPELAQELNFTYVSFEDLLQQSDIISIHVPYLPSTHHLINKGNLKLIKKGCILINTARGAVVETEALIQGLSEGIFGGAGLDVLEEEGNLKNEVDFLLNDHPDKDSLKTMLQEHILMEMENVIITPHNAYNTKEAVQRILDTTAENIEKFIEGHPQNVVNFKPEENIKQDVNHAGKSL